MSADNKQLQFGKQVADELKVMLLSWQFYSIFYI